MKRLTIELQDRTLALVDMTIAATFEAFGYQLSRGELMAAMVETQCYTRPRGQERKRAAELLERMRDHEALVDAVREYKRLFETQDAGAYDARCKLFALVPREEES